MKKISHSLTIFLIGATGDLAKTKIIKAIYELYLQKLLPDKFTLVGNSRKEFSQVEFIEFVKDLVKPQSQEKFDGFKKSLKYVPGDVGSVATFEKLKATHRDFEQCGNHLWYVATLPSLYSSVVENIKQVGMNSTGCGWSKILLEKPFGIDLETAKQLNEQLLSVFKEEQIYRIDHFLAKETVQNLLAFRFANGLFEHLWNKNFIDHIQVSSIEDIGIKGRERFYNTTGTLRDVVQNHVLTMLATALMEEPEKMTADSIRAKRQKLVSQIKSVGNPIFGQYKKYQNDIKLAGIEDESKTETAFAGKFLVNNETWEGVPIYIRAGKKLKRRVTEISFIFKNPSNDSFCGQKCPEKGNVLTLRIQPNEGILVQVNVKKPGLKMELESVPMQFCYQSEFQMGLVEAYVKLIHDAVLGEQMLFPEAYEIESSWSVLSGLQQYQGSNNFKLAFYDGGSWGPSEFDRLLQIDGKVWLEPSVDICQVLGR